MKLSRSFGKLMFANIVLGAVTGVMRGLAEKKPTPAERDSASDFDDEIINAMVNAAKTGDIKLFARCYKSIRPFASDASIYETYGRFAKQINKG